MKRDANISSHDASVAPDTLPVSVCAAGAEVIPPDGDGAAAGVGDGAVQDDQLNLDHLKPAIVITAVDDDHIGSETLSRILSARHHGDRPLHVVTDAPAPVSPMPMSSWRADGEALWQIVEKKRELTTREDLSPELREGLAESAAFDQMRAQLRAPRPRRPQAQEQRQAS